MTRMIYNDTILLFKFKQATASYLSCLAPSVIDVDTIKLCKLSFLYYTTVSFAPLLLSLKEINNSVCIVKYYNYPVARFMVFVNVLLAYLHLAGSLVLVSPLV